jgi:hypothetical protein
MFDSSVLVRKFHDENINLNLTQRQDMQKRRDLNVERLELGLAEMKKPSIVETLNQGGNAMQTMTQQPEADVETRYDIDLGVVFEAADALTPVTTKGWVRDAIAKKAQNLKSAPEAKKKCVRVVYSEGYQCDFPVFKRISSGSSFRYQIAIADEWKDSDPKAINKWFEDVVKDKSPEKDSDFQLRRIARMLKYFSKVHSHHSGAKLPAGIVATALAVECYSPVEGRDDEAFYKTLKNLSMRSEYGPVIANGTIVSGEKDVARIKRLREHAAEAVSALDKLEKEENSVSDEDVRKAWKKVFRHSYFDSDKAKAALAALSTKSAVAAPAIISGLSQDARLARAEAAAEKVRSTNTTTKPWTR